MKLTRRHLLRGAGLATGLILGNRLGGQLLEPRRALAAPAEAALTFGSIFFVLNGGARTQAVFNGTVGMGTNPFGQISALPVPLSAVMEGSGLDDPAINQHVNLITTCQHHNRTGNHATGRTVACTGFTPDENKPGILSIANYAMSFREIPCVNIGNDTPTTNIGSEISSGFAPIKIGSPLDIQDIVDNFTATQVSPGETQRLDDLRYALSDAFHRSTRYSAPEDIPFFQKKAAGIATQLTDDALDIRSDASMGSYFDDSPVDNAALRGSFGVNGDGGGNPMGAKAMLALRLRQLGCAGITISSSQNWDLHSNEDANLPQRAFRLGQSLAGLIEHMSQIPDPWIDGLSLLDTTVITVLTDFNRGNWSQASGFNGNSGSDHQSGDDKTSMQCIPIIGGGAIGGRILGEIAGDGAPLGNSPVYETRQVLATVLDLMGIPAAGFFPGVAPLTEELT
jgi:Protein of unknown function (DUF1501)